MRITMLVVFACCSMFSLLSADLVFSSEPSGSIFAADRTEVFAQTGHAGLIEFVAINPGASYLVTKEAGPYVKTWEVATGREIRTIKLETEYGRASNLYFCR